MGIQKAHVSGLSLGAATGMWLAIKYPEKVKSLSLHSGWTEDRPFHKDSGRGMAGDRKSAEERAGDGHSEYLPVVPDTRALCGEARVHPVSGRFREGPTCAACGIRLSSSQMLSLRMTRRLGWSRISAPNTDHVRASRSGDFDTLCRSNDEPEFTARSCWSLRDAHTRRSTKSLRSSIRRPWRSCRATRTLSWFVLSGGRLNAPTLLHQSSA